MNSFERVQRRTNGKSVDKVPNFNIYMTFASKFINEPLSKYYLDYKTLAEANFAMVENFDVDILQAISDPYRETYDFGAAIEFPDDDLPISKIHFLDEPEKINNLKIPKPFIGKRMEDRLNGIRMMKEWSNNEIPVMGWVEGAMAEAGGLRGITAILMDLFERPDWVKELLEIITEVEINFAIEQIRAGADIIGLGDAIASQISPDQYKEFVLPYEQRIFQAVKENGAIPRLHICGDTTALLTEMVHSNADIIDLDWMVDIQQADKLYGGDVIFCGNMDPISVFLNGTKKEVFEATLMTTRDPHSRIISAAGCEIPLGTPHQNLLAHNEALLV